MCNIMYINDKIYDRVKRDRTVYGAKTSKQREGGMVLCTQHNILYLHI